MRESQCIVQHRAKYSIAHLHPMSHGTVYAREVRQHSWLSEQFKMRPLPISDGGIDNHLLRKVARKDGFPLAVILRGIQTPHFPSTGFSCARFIETELINSLQQQDA